MNILLLGKNGQLGWELQRAFAPLGNVIALDRSGQNNLCGDLTNIKELKKTIRYLKPDIIVNAAAYTAVDNAESNQELAYSINAKAPEAIAQEASILGSLFIHYSTDYVFNGNGINFWTEKDIPLPINFYGKTKHQGEQLIQKSNCNYLIFRTSWVYGIKGNNFIKTMLKLAYERDDLNIVSDQIGAPTGVELLADVTAIIARSFAIQRKQAMISFPYSGIYHLAAKGEVSWFDYATFVIEQAKKLDSRIKVNKINALSSIDYKTVALRPLNSRLSCEKIEKTFDVCLPDWQLGVNRVISELLG